MTHTERYAELRVGQSIPPLSRILCTEDLIKYAGASSDFNRAHWDHVYMTSVGFPSVIVHGWLTFAIMCEAVRNLIPVEAADLCRYQTRYHRPQFPGTITCGGQIVRKYEEDGIRAVDVEIWAKDADGNKTASGSAALLFPD